MSGVLEAFLLLLFPALITTSSSVRRQDLASLARAVVLEPKAALHRADRLGYPLRVTLFIEHVLQSLGISYSKSFLIVKVLSCRYRYHKSVCALFSNAAPSIKGWKGVTPGRR